MTTERPEENDEKKESDDDGVGNDNDSAEAEATKTKTTKLEKDADGTAAVTENAVAVAVDDEKKSNEKKEQDKKKYANWPFRDIKEPHPNDVLYGRGGELWLLLLGGDRFLQSSSRSGYVRYECGAYRFIRTPK